MVKGLPCTLPETIGVAIVILDSETVVIFNTSSVKVPSPSLSSILFYNLFEQASLFVWLIILSDNCMEFQKQPSLEFDSPITQLSLILDTLSVSLHKKVGSNDVIPTQVIHQK